jgi:hypothetical protein
VKKGQTTLPHEIGHAFGLLHSFTGISEHPYCDACRENAGSEDTGDFCADTPPIIRNWDCTSPLAATGVNYDSCIPTRKTWDPNPFQNLMSYGSCRNQFSECQKRRVRCCNGISF